MKIGDLYYALVTFDGKKWYLGIYKDTNIYTPIQLVKMEEYEEALHHLQQEKMR